MCMTAAALRSPMPLSAPAGSSEEEPPDVGVDLPGRPRRLDPVSLPLLLVVLNDWHARIHKHAEPLPDGVRVVVRAPLVAAEQPLLHDILRAVEENDEVAVTAHHLLKRAAVLRVARKPVDQELCLSAAPHRLLQQSDSDLRGDDLPLLHHLCHLVALWGAGADMGAKQLPGAEVRNVGELLDELCALRPLPRARAPQHKHYGGRELLGLLSLSLRGRNSLLCHYWCAVGYVVTGTSSGRS
mmetsp:Transcript_23092/g.55253  ORF Transcript_23092/g.55253 Transcript_23092/m.55253 type:complete len:241 (+) Transcript_23092:1010-1732(+)